MTRRNNELTVKKTKTKPYMQYTVSVLSDTFIKRFAEQTNITKKDSHYIMQEVNKLIGECLLSGESVCFPGAGTIAIRNLGKTKLYTPIVNDGKGGFVEKENTYRFSFTPSKKVKAALRFDENKLVDQLKLEQFI